MIDLYRNALNGWKKDFEAYKDLLKYADFNNKKDCIKVIYKGMKNLYINANDLSHSLDPSDTDGFNEIKNFKNSITDITGYKL